MPTVVGTPSEIPVLSGSTEPIGFNFINDMNIGETITNPVITVNDLKTGNSVPNMLAGVAGISGSVVTQSFTNFVPRRQYRVKCCVTLNTNKTLCVVFTLTCSE